MQQQKGKKTENISNVMHNIENALMWPKYLNLEKMYLNINIISIMTA